jgi:hypothetical protein
MLLPALVVLLLSQAPAPVGEASPEPDAAQRAAAAAERSAAAAERAALAAEAVANRLSAVAGEPSAEEKSEEPAAKPPSAGWSGSLGLALISLTGNSETLTFSTVGAANREWGPWKLSLKLAGAYGQTRMEDVTASEVVAMNAGGQVRGDRKLTTHASAFFLGGADTDHVKSLEYRVYGEGGVAILWLDRKEGGEPVLTLRTDLGMRYADESRFQYYPTPAQLPDLTLVAPKLGLGFRYALNKHVAFIEEAEVLTNVVGDARVLVNSLSRINARLTDSLALSVGFEIKHDSSPAAGKVPTDTVLSAGLEVAL